MWLVMSVQLVSVRPQLRLQVKRQRLRWLFLGCVLIYLLYLELLGASIRCRELLTRD